MDTVLFHDAVFLNTVYSILEDLKSFYRIHLIRRILQQSVQKQGKTRLKYYSKILFYIVKKIFGQKFFF